MVGYARYDTLAQLDWLNEVYGLLDPYANLLLPTRKIISKTRNGSRVQKRYDTARSPFQRLCDAGIMDPTTKAELEQARQELNSVDIHRRREHGISCPPQEPDFPAVGTP